MYDLKTSIEAAILTDNIFFGGKLPESIVKKSSTKKILELTHIANTDETWVKKCMDCALKGVGMTY